MDAVKHCLVEIHKGGGWGGGVTGRLDGSKCCSKKKSELFHMYKMFMS